MANRVEASPAATTKPARRPLAALVPWLPVAAAIALTAWAMALSPEARAGMTARVADFGGSTLGVLMGELFTNPWFYLLIVLVLALERWKPARTEQAIWSTGMKQDLLWVPLKLLTIGWILPIYIVALRGLFDTHLSFLRIDAAASLPWGARFTLALLWGDFLFWLIHLIRHHVGVLWRFHAVHHSQRELNFFTEYRVHPVDDLVALTFGFVPVLMVEHSYVSLLAIVWLRHWHTRVCHSNLRTNFGWLRYVLVTPQSHRVHHSIEPRHFDTNFGLTFSIWDHLFGTQYRGYEEYPPTGIADETFPIEQAADSRWAALFDQLVYPFRRAG